MNTLRVKVQRELNGDYCVFTSRNGNAWNGIGVPFSRPREAMLVATAIRDAAQDDGDYTVELEAHGTVLGEPYGSRERALDEDDVRQTGGGEQADDATG